MMYFVIRCLTGENEESGDYTKQTKCLYIQERRSLETSHSNTTHLSPKTDDRYDKKYLSGDFSISSGQQCHKALNLKLDKLNTTFALEQSNTSTHLEKMRLSPLNSSG